ncbi:MAG: GNAT family N-acetyltransferase [Humibacillus sp.]|nr:GNAT family N-acetyltransferase [Humibacillus sp.]MDN5780317.1 GNAT family N-acetyltransferase [Humibacillus sp.]
MDQRWPLHGIRLETGDLTLTVMTEPDLATVISVLPADVGLNPDATTYAGLDGEANRAAVIRQSYWRALGLWSPADWMLPFVVRRDGAVIGVQWLEGPDYLTDRTVDSSSWLVPGERGRGWGRQMRGAVLALAFGPLRADAAISSAVTSNLASLGVSRSLGYQPTYTSVLPHTGEMLQHVRLDRGRWAATGSPRCTQVEGIDLALPLFGLEPA